MSKASENTETPKATPSAAKKAAPARSRASKAPPPKESKPTPSAQAASPRPPITGLVALLGVVLVAIAVAGLGWYGQQQLQLLQADQATLAEQSALQGLEQRYERRIGEIGGRVSNLNQALESRLQTLARLENRLADQVDGRSQLVERIEQLNERIQAEDQDWRIAEAAYLAGIARDRVRFHGDIAGALEALEAADALLVALGGQAIDQREAVNAATERLLAVQTVDSAAISVTLSTLGEQIDALPLAEGMQRHARSGAPTAQATLALTDTASWAARFERAWQQLQTGLYSLVTVSRNRQVEPLPDAESRFLLQQNLMLQIQTARIAMLREQPEVYREALSQIERWVVAYFDSAAPAVAEVTAQLQDLKRSPVAIDRPDLSAALAPLLNGGNR